MAQPSRRALLCMMGLVAQVAISTAPTFAIDLLNDDIQFSALHLNLRPYFQVPFGLRNVISMTTRPNDPRLYVTTQEGAVFAVNENQNGETTAKHFFDAPSSIHIGTGRMLNGSSGQDGLQSIAFHPEFDHPESPGYGKFYTTLLETRPASTAGHHYLGNPNGGDPNRDSVLVEWTYDFNFGATEAETYREVFRSRLPVGDHMIKQAKFNPYAQSGRRRLRPALHFPRRFELAGIRRRPAAKVRQYRGQNAPHQSTADGVHSLFDSIGQSICG